MDTLAYIMEAKGINQTIGHRRIDLRDRGKLSFGKIVWILVPRPLGNVITNSMSLLASHIQTHDLVEANLSFSF